jgi:hypothetical protein
MKHYFGQIAPGSNPETARKELWRSVDFFGKERSREKEKGIEKRILGSEG